MKKILTIILLIVMAVTSFSGCNKTAKDKFVMDAELITALEKTEFTQAKNIILMIGDGMGFNQLEAAQAAYADKLYQRKMAWSYLPMVSSQSSSSASDIVTDSAAGGTALSTGYRTTNGVVAMDMAKKINYKTVLELAAEKGKSTGVVVTKDVTDATPASFTAHVEARTLQDQIAVQQMEKLIDGSLDIILGGGAERFASNTVTDVKKMAEENGVSIKNTWEETTKASLPLAGLFCNGNMDTTDEKMPSIAEMTDFALEKLSKDENGFFLMIEGSQIDTFGHASALNEQLRETYNFDRAIVAVLRFMVKNPDTVLIITADHETGGLIIPAEVTKENYSDSYYTSNGTHTQVNVPVLAIGYGVEALAGINHNTDVAIFIAKLLGEENFGQEKTVHTLFDMSVSENITDITAANQAFTTAGDAAVTVNFDVTNSLLLLPTEVMDVDLLNSEIAYAKTVAVSMKNVGTDPIIPPVMKLNVDNRAYTVTNSECYIDPGETVYITYVLPVVNWKTRLEKMDSITLSYGNGTVASIEVGNIYLTERPAKT